jgi:hypothetical protein
MNRPELYQISFPIDLNKPKLIITMSEGQWDGLLQAAYDDDWILLEVDANETPVKAYRKPRC